MGKPLDLTNQKFGKLTALKRLDKKYVRSYYWLCQCECGNYCEIPVPLLRSGNRTSCGCGQYDGLKKYNLQQSENNKIENGTKFGKLTVIEDLGFRQHVEGHNRRWYKCLCDCGNFKEVMGNSLKTGNVCSCGECNFSSKGEYQIAQLLDANNICYQHDIVFPELYKQTGRKLRFDFIIYNDDYTKPLRFIEFDGRQHTSGPEATWTHTDSLEEIQARDKIKNQFCLINNYDLVRIPAYMVNNIKLEHILGNKYLITKEGDFCDK